MVDDEPDCFCEWVDCWNGCEDGMFDEYEEDPIACAPGEYRACDICGGHGGWIVHDDGCPAVPKEAAGA